jgi:Zn-dependent peptidase ImmA (M78 family)
MILTVNYADAPERNLQEELDDLEFYFSLPKSFYVRSEIIYYNLQKYKLLNEIQKEKQENEYAFRESRNCS